MKLAPHKQWWFMVLTVHIPSTGVIKHPGAPSAGGGATCYWTWLKMSKIGR